MSQTSDTGGAAQSAPKRIFISSTAEDLKECRGRVADVVERLGQSTTRMEVFGARPGTPLAECQSLARKADALVVIVAHRYGWVPTVADGGDGKKSITWLEVEAAAEADKPVFAFLVDEGVPWPYPKEQDRLTTAKPEEFAEIGVAVQSLGEFKRFLSSEFVRDTFTGAEDLATKVSTSLGRWLLRDQQAGTSELSSEATLPPDYLTWLKGECADIDLLGLKVQHGRAVTLNHVYVPLTTRPDRDEERGHLPDRDEDEPAFELLLNQLNKESLYVSGAPGSGKSTFCRWVAWLACEGCMPVPEIVPPEGYAETYPVSLAGRLPLLVRLRDFWNHLPSMSGSQEMTKAELESALANWLDTKQMGGLKWSVVLSHLQAGSLLLILDGVDEIPLSHGDGSNTYHPRAMLLSGLSRAARKWTEQGNRLLLTSRPYGLNERDRQSLSISEAMVGDLDENLRELLVKRWFHCLIEDAERAAAAAAEMLQHVAQRTDIAPLTSNPMLLTAICIVYHQGRRLPQDRHDLYDRIVDNVLFNRFPDDREVIDIVRNRLAVIAYGMHTGDGLGEDRVTPEAEATYDEIDRMLQSYQDQTRWTEPSFTGAVTAREQLLGQTGLLLPRGERRAGFYHFTLQDYLAAQRLLVKRRDDLLEAFRQYGESPEWRSTLTFVFGSHLAKDVSPERSILLSEQLVEGLGEADVALSIVVSDCLQILLKRGLRLQEDLETSFKRYCLSAIEREVGLRDRFELGIGLGHLGDPRIVTDLRDPAAYVEIPGGTYPIGGEYGLDEQEYRVERPFLLSRYPVTNAQYRVFVEADGYKKRQWWSDEGWQLLTRQEITEPRFWRNTKWNAPNQPVVGVSWFEAEALANWAGACLPSEREWEAAARGPDGCRYPWGEQWEDGICNGNNILESTSTVGIFPRSRSHVFKLEDMAGNVWQWCVDRYEPDSESRVLRGGSFLSSPPVLRSAYRVRDAPDIRDRDLGFRLSRTP